MRIPKFFWINRFKKFPQENKPISYGIKFHLGLFGGAWHSKKDSSGVFRNGKNWILWSGIDDLGLICNYKGDEIIWVWPWKRYKNYDCPWSDIFISFAPFKTLKDIDKFWEDWSNSLRGGKSN